MVTYSNVFPLFLLIFELAYCQELRVGVMPGPPIASKNNQGVYYGFGIDMWEQSVEEMNQNFGYNLTYNFVPLDTLRDMTAQLFKNQIDLAIYAVVPPPNVFQVVSSTIPYYSTVVHTVSRESKSNGTTFALVWRMFLDSTFLAFLLIICMFSVICAHIIWHVEKKSGNVDFPKNYKLGIGHSLYWAWSTISLVGFGDVHVASGLGKSFTVGVVIFSLVLLNVFAGIVCSFVTTNSIAPVAPTRDAFSGVSVAAMRNSYCVYFLQLINAQIVPVSNIQEGIDLVQNETVVYFVAEQSSLIGNLTEYDKILIQMSGPSYDNINYTFLYSNSPVISQNFTRDLDRSIALFQLSDDYTALRDSYFSSAPFPTPEIGFMRAWGPAMFFFFALLAYFVVLIIYHYSSQKEPGDTKESNSHFLFSKFSWKKSPHNLEMHHEK